MTRLQLSKLKQEFIEKRQEFMKGRITSLQKKLYDEIFDKIIDELNISGGKIISNGENIRLSAALDKVFKTFQTNEFTPVIAQFGKDLLNITQLNKNYFKIASDKHIDQVNKAAAKSEEKLKSQLGISEKGKFVKKSYLDRLITDEALKKKVKQVTLKAITNKRPVEDLIKEMKRIVVGDSNTNGGLVRHFEQFMRDTYTQADRTSSTTFATTLSMKAFVYQGGRIRTSRCFCVKNDNKVFTIEEAQKWKSLIDTDCGPIWSDKDGAYQPLTHFGGVNCRHVGDFISNSLAKKLRPDLADVL